MSWNGQILQGKVGWLGSFNSSRFCFKNCSYVLNGSQFISPMVLGKSYVPVGGEFNYKADTSLFCPGDKWSAEVVASWCKCKNSSYLSYHLHLWSQLLLPSIRAKSDFAQCLLITMLPPYFASNLQSPFWTSNCHCNSGIYHILFTTPPLEHNRFKSF